MKKIAKLVASAAVSIGMFLAVSTAAYASYSFDVISDTHIGATDGGGYHAETNTKKALDSIAKYYPKDECVVINGDVVNQGTPWNYNELRRIISERYTNSSLPYIYYNIGNHEYMSNGTCKLFNDKTNDIRKLIRGKNSITKNDRQATYDLQYINSKNDRLVFLGTDTVPSNDCDAYIDPSHIDWLGKVIDKSKEEWETTSRGKKPIFIFIHQPLINTVYGSQRSSSEFSNWGQVMNTSTINDYALKGHSEAIVFTGHSHKQFDEGYYYGNSNNYATLGGASIFGCPSIAESNFEPEGYHVTVYSDGVVVKGVKYKGFAEKPEVINTRTILF